MIDAATLALRDILSPPFRGVLLKSLALTIGLLVALWLALEWLLAHLVATSGPGSTPFSTSSTGVGLVVGLGFLVAPVAALFVGFFLDDIAEAVERTHYPADPPGRPLPIGRSLLTSLKFLGVVLLVNALALPLVLFLGFGVVDLPRRQRLSARPRIFRARGAAPPRRSDGAAPARSPLRPHLCRRADHCRFLAIPIVNLLAPLFATAFMVHLERADRNGETSGYAPAGLWIAIPIATSAMPRSSMGEGICPSTTAPTIAAVAGRSASISAKVARGSRAIASWSQT